MYGWDTERWILAASPEEKKVPLSLCPSQFGAPQVFMVVVKAWSETVWDVFWQPGAGQPAFQDNTGQDRNMARYRSAHKWVAGEINQRWAVEICKTLPSTLPSPAAGAYILCSSWTFIKRVCKWAKYAAQWFNNTVGTLVQLCQMCLRQTQTSKNQESAMVNLRFNRNVFLAWSHAPFGRFIFLGYSPEKSCPC